MKHLENNQILYDLQHGFRQSRSCETQLVSFINDITKSYDLGKQTDILLMDIAKVGNLFTSTDAQYMEISIFHMF